MLNYILVIISALMFSLNFFSSKLFQQTSGDGVMPSIAKTFYASIISVIFYMVLSKFTFEFTWFSLIISLVYTLDNFILAFASFKAFKYADLALYSIFMMMGSVVLPSLFGILFYNEPLTVYTAICYVFILLSLLITIKKTNNGGIAYLFYLLVFCGNGAAGIISKIHQASSMAVSTENYLLMSCASQLLVAGIILAIVLLKGYKTNKLTSSGNGKYVLPKYFSVKACLIALVGGVIIAGANLLNIGALTSMPISIHSVITTGGVIVFSALVSVVNKEKLSTRTILSMIFAIIAVVFATLPW